MGSSEGVVRFSTSSNRLSPKPLSVQPSESMGPPRWKSCGRALGKLLGGGARIRDPVGEEPRNLRWRFQITNAK